MEGREFLTALLIAMFIACLVMNADSTVTESGKPCTYFDDARVSSTQDNLINCTWYRQNACCKRTEVTSVFGTMLPLYGATEECSNRMNYMMCYFCSPEQYRWFKKKVHVAADFCSSVYQHCKTAEYNGIAIGDAYISGEDLCHGQRFEVVEGSSDAFDFDPDVFSGISGIHSVIITMATGCIIACSVLTNFLR